MESILLISLHWEKIWCIFPKGRNCDLGVVLERFITACINWTMIIWDFEKVSYTYPASFHKFKWLWDRLWSHFWQLPRGNWSPNLLVKTPTLNRTLNKFVEVIVRSKNIHENYNWFIISFIHLLWIFGSNWVDLNTKTLKLVKSQKKWKNWKIEHFNKITKKGYYKWY